MKTTSKQHLLTAFERLFERANSKLALDCTEEERAEARRSFVNRFECTLDALDEMGLPPISEATIQGMEQSIDELKPSQIAGYLATGPLVLQVQKLVRAVAARAAEQRLIERLVANADDTYGGN